MTRSFVVTGGGRGIGRAIAERLARDGHVVVVDLEPGSLDWATGPPRVTAVAGDAGDEAVALGSIATDRYDALARGRDGIEEEMRRLHPLGRPGRPAEVAAVVAHLLSGEASYVNGAVVPVDGGRAALGQDPEARDVAP